MTDTTIDRSRRCSALSTGFPTRITSGSSSGASPFGVGGSRCSPMGVGAPTDASAGLLRADPARQTSMGCLLRHRAFSVDNAKGVAWWRG